MSELRQRYIHHRNLLNTGNTELGLVLGAFQQGTLLWLVLRDMFNIPAGYFFAFVPLCIVAITTLKYVYGRFYLSKRLYDEDALFYSTKNPEFQELKQDVKRLAEKCE